MNEPLTPCACGCGELVTKEVRSHRRFYNPACRARFSYQKLKLLNELKIGLLNINQLVQIKEAL